MNRLKLHKEPLFKELLSLPTKNYWVTFMYTTKKNPDKYIYFSFPQFDVEPYFPRVNHQYAAKVNTSDLFIYLYMTL